MGVILEMYGLSIRRMTHEPLTHHYNAVMNSIGMAWRRLDAVLSSIGTAWARLWELPTLITDSALALLLSVWMVAASGSLSALLITGWLIWRRRLPLLVLGLVLLGTSAVSDSTSSDQAIYPNIIALMVAAYSVGAYSKYRLLSISITLGVSVFIVAVFGGTLPPVPEVAGPFVVLVPMWFVGNALRTRQMRADALGDRAMRLERDQEEATRVALAEERGRITRELHDVVAHSVSVMVVQAGAARQVLTASPDQAREALLAVETSGREAMTELRNLLGLLSDDAVDVALAPQPGVDGIEALLQRVGDAGLPVDLRVEGSPRPLPPGVDLTAYRIVQEALTNCLKYSGLARTEVILDYRESELKVEILDEGLGNGSHAAELQTGRGLVGMRERTALYGGTLEAGPRLDHGYAVRAWLPL